MWRQHGRFVMEIFIPGIILVALMVYASTRIKRNAAAAYNEEIIDNEKFFITKPEGFLSPVDPPESMLFAAYSKEFGHDEAGELHRATIELYLYGSLTADERIAELESEIDIKHSETAGVIDENKRFIITGIVFENGAEVIEKHLLIAGSDGLYDLTTKVLKEHDDEFSAKLDEMSAGFRLK